MCGRFVVLTREEVADAVRAVEERGLLVPLARDGIARMQARPSAQVDIIDAQLQSTQLTWGFAFPWHNGPVFNARVESLLSGSAAWRGAAREGRCVIPAASFFEPHATETVPSPRTGKPMKRPYEFSDPQGTALLLAGISGGGTCSIVTTEPNGQVEPVHNRMPLALTPAEAADWLDASWNDAQLLELWSTLADRARFELVVAPEHLAAPARIHEAGNAPQLSLF